MGFAIPINDAKDRIDSLSKKILTIGITGVSIDEDRAKASLVLKGDVFQTMFPGFII